jgi:hypothetical protein
MNLGYYEEAKAWRDWLLRTVAGMRDQVQIIHGVKRRTPPPGSGARGIECLVIDSASM